MSSRRFIVHEENRAISSRPRTFPALFLVALACGLWADLAAGAAAPVPDDLVDRKREIARILDHDLVRHAEANGGELVPDDALEWDISRLEAQLSFMDNALRSLPCGSQVPAPLDAGAALAALQALSSSPEAEARLTDLEEERIRISERRQYVEEIHAIANMVYKLHLIGAMTELIVHAIPVDDVLTILGVLDDATNFTEPGNVPDWNGRDQYKQYIANNREAVELGVVNKLRRMDRFDENGNVRVANGERLRLIAEVVRAETEKEARELEAEAKQVEQSIAEAQAEVERTRERDRYFKGLIERVEATLDGSVWIQRPETFAQEEVVLDIFLVDEDSGHAIHGGNVEVGSLAALTAHAGKFRFQGLSLGTHRVSAAADGYEPRRVPTDITSCREHSLVVRLKRKAATPSPASPAPASEALNRPPTVSLLVDADRVPAGETIRLNALAEDPEQQELAYEWSASAGNVAGSGPRVELDTAGVAPQALTVVVTVRDPKGATGQDSRTLALTPPKALTAELSCGGRLELVAGEVARSCGVVVKGWRGNTDDRVEVIVVGADNSGSLPGDVVVFPDRTSQGPANMFTAGTTDFHDRYEFPFHFSARATAPEGRVPVSLLVRQRGAGEVRLSLTVNVLPKGRIAVPGAGDAPPPRPGSGGEYCVWRYKLFSETNPNCWQFVAAGCNDPRYGNSRNGYVLAGSNMSRSEADALIGEQSAYFSECGETVTDGSAEDAHPAGDGSSRCHELAAQARAALDRGDTPTAMLLLERAEREGCGNALADVVQRLNEVLALEARREERERFCTELVHLVAACEHQEAATVAQELLATQPDATCAGVDLGGLREQAIRESDSRALLRRAQSTIRGGDLEGAIVLLRESLARAPACMASEIEALLADMEARESDAPAWLGGSSSSEREDPPEERAGSSEVPEWIAAGGEDEREQHEDREEDSPPAWIAEPGPSGVSEENRERAARATEEAGRQLAQIRQEEAERQRRLEEQRREEERRRRELERRREEERRVARARERERREAEQRREEAERAERGRAWAEALDRVLVTILDHSGRRGSGGGRPPSPPSSEPVQEDFLEDIVVRSYRVTISVWDAECEDGDRISVYINGTPFLTNRTLYNAKESFTVDLPYQSNSIEVVALNGGTDCPPGRKPLDQTVNSGAISISSAVRGGQQRWRLRQRGGSTAQLIVRP